MDPNILLAEHFQPINVLRPSVRNDLALRASMATKKGSKDQEPKVEAKKGGLASKRPVNSTFGETVLEVAPLQ